MKSQHDSGPIETWLVRVSGRVQGVGFRHACVREAGTVGVTGWVRNRADGSVETMLQGSPEQLQRMCHWLRHGVRAAIVDGLDVTVVGPPVQRVDGFGQRATV